MLTTPAGGLMRRWISCYPRLSTMYQSVTEHGGHIQEQERGASC